ncbi:hypothetical protein [Devosia sp.]|uniref:hypothetical protein n=1 Tax=Devosia sp. TaxID=1871048 RepID=UPI001AD54073|nr:hypothetical protein [Devosia sp.]MBN9309076.1 hypothetical protein [Devosia sp.]
MTFKYSATFPISGGNKLRRFAEWAKIHLPGLGYVLPPQTPIKTETMTIRLRSVADRALVLQTLARVPLPQGEGVVVPE